MRRSARLRVLDAERPKSSRASASMIHSNPSTARGSMASGSWKMPGGQSEEKLSNAPVVPDGRLADQKWLAWEAMSKSSPFPNFRQPTAADCEVTYDSLNRRHRAAVGEEFNDPNTPETIHHVLDAMMIALLSQATSWSNAKRAMDSMKVVYGSVYAYDQIYSGGRLKLEEAIRCGGLHVRKSTLIFAMLQQVHDRLGKWDMDHLFDASDEQAMKELLSYKGIGPKCAFVVLSWCLKRNPFTVDTHVYRIAKLWGWIPKDATRNQAQAHLDAVVPKQLKFDLHFLFIAHGRICPTCKGGSKIQHSCDVREEILGKLAARDRSSTIK